MSVNNDLIIKETLSLAIKNYQQNELSEAQILYDKILKIDPTNVIALNNLGVIYQEFKEYPKSVESYEKAIKFDPTHAQSLNNLGFLYQKLGKLRKAQSCLEKAIEIDPNSIDANNNLGVLYQKSGEYQKAQSYFEKVIEINPDFQQAIYNLGVIHGELDEHQKAQGYFEKVIEINPKYLDAYNNLGVLYQKLGELRKAQNYLEKAIEIDPNYINAHYNLGVLFNDIGEYTKAIFMYEKLIKINPIHNSTLNNLGGIYKLLHKDQKAKFFFEEVIKLNPNHINAHSNLSALYIRTLDNFEKSMNSSYKALKIHHKNSKFINQSVPLFRLKHDVQQAQYLISKNYKIVGVYKFQKIGDEILSRTENKEVENNSNKKILLNKDEISSLLPFYKSDHIYQVKNISGSCINQNKNWLDVEDEYLNSTNQIMYIDDFLSDEALIELREFCLVSKVWYKEYDNKYLGAFSDSGFISPIHLQIATDLQQKLPKLFGPHKLGKFWGFKYDSTLGKGINIHADFAIHNLNFWITPDEYNNNKNSGGLKIYDAPAPDNWTFKNYNINGNEIYKFLKENNANCTNVPYKFNRAVLFNSAYFHETDEIDFKDNYVGRRINNTYLFGTRLVKSSLD